MLLPPGRRVPIVPAPVLRWAQIVAVIAVEECRFMIGRGGEYGHLNAIFIICIICTLVNMNN